MPFLSLIKGEAHPENQVITRISAGLQEIVEELDGMESEQTNTVSAHILLFFRFYFQG